jgi:hypothetical protein
MRIIPFESDAMAAGMAKRDLAVIEVPFLEKIFFMLLEGLGEYDPVNHVDDAVVCKEIYRDDV